MTDERSDADRRAAFETALGSEYFALNGLRAGTTAEANARATLYFTTLNGTLLTLGFLYGNTTAAAPVSYAALPTVGILGLLSFLRLVELAALDAVSPLPGHRPPSTSCGSFSSRLEAMKILCPDAEMVKPHGDTGQEVENQRRHRARGRPRSGEYCAQLGVGR